MANICKFWNFRKRRNSTALPTDDMQHEEWNVLFKLDTDILAPTLEVHNDGVLQYNYCYIPFFGRYYFFKNVETIAKDQYLIYLEIDVAGTFKEEIKGQSVFLAYSSYDYDVNLNDNRVAPTDASVSYTTGHSDIIPGVGDYHTIVALSGKTGGSTINGVAYLVDQNIQSILDKMNDVSELQSTITDLAGVNPLDYIAGMWATPLNPSKCHSMGGANSNILGLAIIAGNGITSPATKRDVVDISLPAPTYSDFRISDAYMQYFVSLPYCGTVKIPTQLGAKYKQITVYVSGDCFTGTLTYSVKIGEMSLGTYTATMKCDLPVTSTHKQTTAGAAFGILNGGAEKLAARALNTVDKIAAAAIGVTAESIYPTDLKVASGSVSGGMGLASAVGSTEIIAGLQSMSTTYNPANYTALKGRPSNRISTIKEGYLVTAGASVTISGTSAERDMLNTMLDGGLYYE